MSRYLLPVKISLAKIEPATCFWAAVALAATVPVWIVRYPSIQDLPVHLASIRVIHDFHDARYGFDQQYVLSLGRTQYVLYYLLASALAYLLGVVKANTVLMCVYLGGTPLAVRALLRALGKDERLALFSVPLLPNPMFMFGLLPFLLGIPTFIYALSVAVRYFEEPTRARGVWLAILTAALFHSHFFPFALFGLGFAFMFPWTSPRRWLLAGAPVVPALLLAGRWALFTDAGRLTTGVLHPTDADKVAPLNAAIPGAYPWLLDMWKDGSDDVLLILTVVSAILVTGMAQGDPDRSVKAARPYTLLPIACIAFYFLLGERHGYIWLVAQRFPILCFFSAIPLLRMPRGVRGWICSALVLGLGVGSTVNTCKHFIAFQRDEVGDIDGAIDAMEPRKRVVALIYDKWSKITNYAPFLHFGSYYQLEKGGTVQFSFAGYPHWPFDYLPGHYPPPGRVPRENWEWSPEQVPIEEVYPYYDYVLTRGSGFTPPPGTFRIKWQGDRWTVWERAR